MNDVTQALETLRNLESGGDYAYQQGVRVGGETDTKLGAYGILSTRWKAITEAMGLVGANWRDTAVQDHVARKKLERDYTELGSWEMAAVAFRFGTQAARQLVKAGYTEPKDIEGIGYDKIGRYLRDIRANTVSSEQPVDGTLTRPQKTKRVDTPGNKRADDVVRNQLRAMLNAQSSAQPKPEPEVTE